MNIHRTAWAKRFKKQCPFQYEQAIEYAQQESLEVTIELRDDLEKPLWAIVVKDSDDFWMDAFDTEAESLRLCKRMGWIYK